MIVMVLPTYKYGILLLGTILSSVFCPETLLRHSIQEPLQHYKSVTFHNIKKAIMFVSYHQLQL